MNTAFRRSHAALVLSIASGRSSGVDALHRTGPFDFSPSRTVDWIRTGLHPGWVGGIDAGTLEPPLPTSPAFPKKWIVPLLVAVLFFSGYMVRHLSQAWERTGVRRRVPVATAPAHADPHARASIAAFDGIGRALASGSLDLVPEHATLIAEVFAPFNPEISQTARELARATTVDEAVLHYARLTSLLYRRPSPTPIDPSKAI